MQSSKLSVPFIIKSISFQHVLVISFGLLASQNSSSNCQYKTCRFSSRVLCGGVEDCLFFFTTYSNLTFKYLSVGNVFVKIAYLLNILL